MEELASPLVTILMPAYQAAAYIDEAIASVAAQTFPDWELLVLDDASSDATAEIAQRWAERDARICLLRNEKNLGAAATRNRGLTRARGRFIALLDSDDFWLPQKLQKQLDLAASTGAEMVYCSYAMHDETGARRYADFLVPPETDFHAMLAKNVMSCSTVLLRAEALDGRGFPTEVYHEDYALWMQLLREEKRACGVPEVLAVYRIRRGSRSSDKCASAANRWRIYRRTLRLSLPKAAAAFVRYALAGLKKYR